MRILHFSVTPLAGAPIRLVRSLQQHSSHEVRLVDHQRFGTYQQDLIFSENRDFVISLAEQADIIHFHNFISIHSQEFHPIDFTALQKKGTQFVCQFHSTPQVIAQKVGVLADDIFSSSIPSLVIAQFQERYFPGARVVPNILPIYDSSYCPGYRGYDYDIVFTPTNWTGAEDDRWNTKGARETAHILQQLSYRQGANIKIVSDAPLEQVLEIKQRSRIMIDDLITGSYHLSGLEGLSLGMPTLAYLDSRTEYVLRVISGALELPVINVGIENGYQTLKWLLTHPTELVDMGKASRDWMERYWDDRLLVQHYEFVYQQLMQAPHGLSRQEELRLDREIQLFQAIILPDLIHFYRSKRIHFGFSVLSRLRFFIGKHLYQPVSWIYQHLPHPFQKVLGRIAHLNGILPDDNSLVKPLAQQ